MTTIEIKKAPAFSKHLHPTQHQSYADVLAADTRPIPEVIRQSETEDIGPAQVPVRWYMDRQIHEMEKEKIWKKSWQMACRVDDIPAVGDTYIHKIVGLSFLIVRTAPDTVKAYWNSCPHRGAELASCPSSISRIQCPFHGFTWSLEGKCVLVPYPEEFPLLQKEKLSLSECKIAVWEDFVFINPDANAESFESYAGKLTGQFDRWSYKGRYKVLHFAKVFNVNWKALQEAFMESWHVLTVHPQFSVSTADRCSEHWASGNFSRGVVAQGQTSDYVTHTPSEQDIMDTFVGVWEDMKDKRPPALTLPPGTTARTALAAGAREMLRPALGAFVDEMCDAECVDVFYWTLFPNFHPFGGYNQPFVYRFTPYQDDHTRSVMEGIFLLPVPPGAEVPPSKPIRWLTDDEDFTALPELGSFGSFLSQDIANMGGIAGGLHSNQRGYVNFAASFELKIRHFYSLYEKWMGLSAEQEVAALKAGAGPT